MATTFWTLCTAEQGKMMKEQVDNAERAGAIESLTNETASDRLKTKQAATRGRLQDSPKCTLPFWQNMLRHRITMTHKCQEKCDADVGVLCAFRGREHV